MGKSTTDEDIKKQFDNALLLLSSMEKTIPPTIGEINLNKFKAIPTIENPEIQANLDECHCFSTRGIVDVSNLQKLISKGHNIVDESPTPTLSDTYDNYVHQEEDNKLENKPPPPPSTTTTTTMWDEEFASTHNVKVTRPSHDAWGIKKIVLMFCDDFMQTVYEFPFWHSPSIDNQSQIPNPNGGPPIDFKSCIMPVLETLGLASEEGQTRIVRMLLASMPPGVTIPVHHDTGEWVPKSHRVHIPIITNTGKVLFQCGPNVDNMKRISADEGRVFEMNNQAKHFVANHWEEYRVHVILDYVEKDNAYSLPRRRLKLEAGEEVIQTRRSIDRKSEFGSTKTPSFIVIGAQKAGTTSVYEYLNRHPLVVSGKRR